LFEGDHEAATRMSDQILDRLCSERQELQGLLLQEPAGLWRRMRRLGRWLWSADSDTVPPGERLSDRDRRVLRDPEARKNVEILAARIADAIDRQPRTPALTEATTNRLAKLVGEARQALSLEALLDTRRSVEDLLLEHADLPLLREWTAGEYAEEEATLPTWRRLYGVEQPDLLNEHLDPSSDAVEATRMRLQRLVAARFWLYRPLRARRSLRTRYLWRLVPVLFVLGLLLAVAMTLALPQGARPVWLAAAAGAAGASLSGLLSFRDEVRLGAQVRAFVPFYLAQVVVGGVFGLLFLLVLTAGWLDLQSNSAQIGAVAFAAGFSEPFAVGVLARMTERSSG
jgi:hypothetical protein